MELTEQKPRRGRPPGSKNKRTKAFSDLYDRYSRKYKFDPVEFLFRCAANELPCDLDENGNPVSVDLSPEFRAQCAKDLLPYKYSKKTAVDHGGIDGTPIQFSWIVDESSPFTLPAPPEPDSPTQ